VEVDGRFEVPDEEGDVGQADVRHGRHYSNLRASGRGEKGVGSPPFQTEECVCNCSPIGSSRSTWWRAPCCSTSSHGYTCSRSSVCGVFAPSCCRFSCCIPSATLG